MDNVGYIKTHKVTIVELGTDNETRIDVQSGEDLSTGAFIIWCLLNDQEIVSTQDKYFAAFQQFRDKLLEAGYGIKCNGARLNVFPLSKFENGPRVYVLESGAKALPEDTVDIWDKADIDEFPDSRQQNRFINKWSDEHLGKPEQYKEHSKLCLAGFILTVSPPAWLLLSVIFRELYLVWIAGILLSPLLGLIFSIAGVATADRSGKRGKGFGIAGIVIQCVCLVVAVVCFGPALMEHAYRSKRITSNEMYPLGRLGVASNTEYDVTKYMLPEGYDLKSSDITVTDTDFESYASTKLQKISKKTYKSIRGDYQDYGFLIVRSDRFDEWLSVNTQSDSFYYYNGYACILHLDWWEFAGTQSVPLAVYKDPSDKYIIITNCNDYKVITEFFEQ